MPRTRIKICGVRDEETLYAAAEAGADAVGFVFVKGSPRYLDPEDAFALMGALPPFMASVGVFADRTIDDFLDVEERCPTQHAQLHGEEDEQLVRACGPDVIKAVRFDAATIGAELARWAEIPEVAAVLVDGPKPGSGESIDWEALADAADSVAVPLILAGGLTPENVGEAIRIVRPWGVDVSSGVERERGVKDAALIEAFCEAVRDADRAL